MAKKATGPETEREPTVQLATDFPAQQTGFVSPATLPAPEKVELPRWRVSLGSNGPTSDHEAADIDGAWEAFKAAHGIIASDHQPKITRVEPGQEATTPADKPEVRDHFGKPVKAKQEFAEINV